MALRTLGGLLGGVSDKKGKQEDHRGHYALGKEKADVLISFLNETELVTNSECKARKDTESLRVVIPGQFEKDFDRGKFSFLDVTPEDAYPSTKPFYSPKITTSLLKDGSTQVTHFDIDDKQHEEKYSDIDQKKLDDILYTYFRDEAKVAQVKKITQGLAEASWKLGYLNLISASDTKEKTCYNPFFKINFIRIKGSRRLQDRFFINIEITNDILNSDPEDLSAPKILRKTDSGNGETKLVDAEGIQAEQMKIRAGGRENHSINQFRQFYELRFNTSKGISFEATLPPTISLYCTGYRFPKQLGVLTPIRQEMDPQIQVDNQLFTILQKKPIKEKEGEQKSQKKFTKKSSEELKFDFTQPVADLKLSKPSLKYFDSAVDSQSAQVSLLSRTYDGMLLQKSIEEHLTSIYQQIDESQFPDDNTFETHAQKNNDKSAFNEQGDLAEWVLQGFSSVSHEDKQVLSIFLKDVFRIGFKGTYTPEGEFHPWIHAYFSKDDKPRLAIAIEKYGVDVVGQYLMGNLVSLLSSTSTPLEPSDKPANSIVLKLVQHQMSFVKKYLECLDKAKKLEVLAQKRKDLDDLAGYQAFSTALGEAIKQLPFGHIDRFIPLIELATKILTLDPNTPEYFFAFEKFKENVKSLKLSDPAIYPVLNKKLVEITSAPDSKIVEYAYTKLNDTPARKDKSHPFHMQVTSAVISLQRKARISNRGNDCKQNAAQAKRDTIVHKRFCLIHQLAQLSSDDKQLPLGTKIFELIEKEKTLKDESCSGELESAIKKFREAPPLSVNFYNASRSIPQERDTSLTPPDFNRLNIEDLEAKLGPFYPDKPISVAAQSIIDMNSAIQSALSPLQQQEHTEQNEAYYKQAQTALNQFLTVLSQEDAKKTDLNNCLLEIQKLITAPNAPKKSASWKKFALATVILIGTLLGAVLGHTFLPFIVIAKTKAGAEAGAAIGCAVSATSTAIANYCGFFKEAPSSRDTEAKTTNSFNRTIEENAGRLTRSLL